MNCELPLAMSVLDFEFIECELEIRISNFELSKSWNPIEGKAEVVGNESTSKIFKLLAPWL